MLQVLAFRTLPVSLIHICSQLCCYIMLILIIMIIYISLICYYIMIRYIV